MKGHSIRGKGVSKTKSKAAVAGEFNPTKSRLHVSRAQRRKHLDERLRSLQQRQRIIEAELYKLESRFYRTCIFGSARIKPGTDIYDQVTELARGLASEGVDILTGGGPGLMEAANLGAQLGRGEKKNSSVSYGLSIELEWETRPNPHLDVKRHHNKFSSRLDDFMRLSHSVIVTPGGIGTVLELMFTWQLIQVKHLEPRPIVLMDSKFWKGIIDWMKEYPLSRKLMNADDFDHIKIVDTPKQVLDIILAHQVDFIKNKKPALDELSKTF